VSGHYLRAIALGPFDQFAKSLLRFLDLPSHND
jgi:hypothetical protein